MNKDDIKLPPLHYDELPESDGPIPAMHAYARKAIKADRQRRSVPVACHRCAEYAKEVQALRKDAERYQWLRDMVENQHFVIAKVGSWSLESWISDDPDRYIDEVMEQKK